MMKYTYKFEEMIEQRLDAINHLNIALDEHKRLIDVLKEHDEKETDEKLKFTSIIDDLSKKVEEMNSTINNYKKQNVNTTNLVLTLKRIDKDTCKVVEDVLDEIGLFKNSEEPKEEN